jgi:sugar/nucleoside kinase (ribokinase family)
MVAVDVQAIIDVDEYHRDFITAADIVLLSTERLSVHSHDFMRKLWFDFDVSVVVATHGEHGATLGVRETQTIDYQRSFDFGAVLDKTGAGDSFCAGFLAAVAAKQSFMTALTSGQLTAAHKIMHKGSTNGFPSRTALDALLAAYETGTPWPIPKD